MKLRMPARQPSDGAVAINRENDGIRLSAEHDCAVHSMFVSEYNAWRLFGLLALMLRIPLTPQANKAITFGDKEVTAKIGMKPSKRLGDRMAAAIVRKRLERSDV